MSLDAAERFNRQAVTVARWSWQSGLMLFLLIFDVTARAEDAPSTSIQQIRLTDAIPFGREPIDYFSSETNDAISRLQQRLDASEVQLKASTSHGYLQSLLEHLEIPVESQLLVFSKTARNPDLVSPRTPRAVYFNDSVSVAWIPNARELEITAIDSVKGATFYTLSQPLTEDAQQPGVKSVTASRFSKNNQCLACHAGRSSLDVPGWLARAFQTDGSGRPAEGYSQVTHELDYSKRWGGWYVTGSPGGFAHRGNLVGAADNQRAKDEPTFRASMTELKSLCAIDRYPQPVSDVVSHIVFNHQVHGLNLLIRVGMEARLARRSDAEDQLVRYFVFSDEAPLETELDQAADKSPYRVWFEAQGQHDSQQRSLRQFDLHSRAFRYRLSFLVAHPLFTNLPTECRSRLVTRILNGLTAAEPPAEFRHLPREERQAIVEIVSATVPAFAGLRKIL